MASNPPHTDTPVTSSSSPIPWVQRLGERLNPHFSRYFLLLVVIGGAICIGAQYFFSVQWPWLVLAVLASGLSLLCRRERVKENLDLHFFFWLALIGCFYVIVFVRQVRNIWFQFPREPSLAVGYMLFLVPLLLFYFTSVFAVMRVFPIKFVHEWIDRKIRKQMEIWEQEQWSWKQYVWYWVSLFTWRLPDLLSRWLVGWASNANQPVWGSTKIAELFGKNPEPISKFLRVVSVVVAFLLIVGPVVGPHVDGSRSYTLAGSFCHSAGIAGLLIGAWLLSQAFLRFWLEDDNPGKISECIGRFLAWLVVVTLLGEFIWISASKGWFGGVLSYRLYAVWAVAHVLAIIMMLALLVDLAHREWQLPIRQVALVGLGVAIWWFSAPGQLPKDDVKRHLKGKQIEAWNTTVHKNDLKRDLASEDEKWFEQFYERIKDIPEDGGPAVIVAASGGGSRAAIFASLALEALTHTPINDRNESIFVGTEPPKFRTWSDNVVLISSISGGSLATAYYVEQLSAWDKQKSGIGRTRGWPSKSRTLDDLEQSSLEGLLLRMQTLGRSMLLEFPGRLEEQTTDPQLVQEYFPEWKEHRHWQQSSDKAEAALNYLLSLKKSIQDKTEELKQRLETNQQHLKEKEESLRNLVQSRQELRLAFVPDGEPQGEALDEESLNKDILRLESESDKIIEESTLAHNFLGLIRAYQTVCAKDDVLAYPPPCGSDSSTEPDADSTLSDLERQRLFWAFKNASFDAMCTDFMAPILRGVLLPSLGRGDSLARFWTDRFDWYSQTNFNGYNKNICKWGYGEHHPVVLFNTSDVAKGSRVTVGFPPLPEKLWKLPFQNVTSVERPKSMSELFYSRRISLSRAVRMSSNFPLGFRPMDLHSNEEETNQQHQGKQYHLHLLDGGIVDNTGLDTIYNVFKALEYFASFQGDPNFSNLDTKRFNTYRSWSKKILHELRKRGVVLYEIDAGAKPDEQLSHGPMETSQALNNAIYTNAELVKALYVKETRRILNRRIQLGKRPSQTEAQTKTTFHLRIQGTPYMPGQASDSPEVMTAWALGPADKANVLFRFLIEMDKWDISRKRTHLYLENAQEQYLYESFRTYQASLLRSLETLISTVLAIQMPSPEQRSSWKKQLAEWNSAFSDLKQKHKELAAPLENELDSIEQKRDALVKHQKDYWSASGNNDSALKSKAGLEKLQRETLNVSQQKNPRNRAEWQRDPQQMFDKMDLQNKKMQQPR